jgi:hypothetical protein
MKRSQTTSQASYYHITNTGYNMNNIKTKAVRLTLAAAGLVLAVSANAASWVDLTGSVNVVSDVGTLALNGVTYQFTDIGSLSVGYYNANSPQGVTQVASLLKNSGLFGLNASSVLNPASSVDSILGNTLTITPPPAFNNLGVHIGGGELLFHWNALNNAVFSLHTSAPVNELTGTSNLSNYRAFTSAVPEPETYGMLLAGLGLVGFLARRRKAA